MSASRPELTFPPEEAEALRAAYAAADVVLEYGSGGSTVMGAEMAGKTITSVESDRKWARMMNAWFADHPPAEGSEVEVVWSNIGPTKAWGHPVDHSEWQRYARYPLGVWQKAGFKAPDVVLVDGRFRVGCALASAYFTDKPMTLYFDDYVERTNYHKVEDFLGAPEIIGRMARFDLTPQPFPKDRWLQLTQFMYRP